MSLLVDERMSKYGHLCKTACQLQTVKSDTVQRRNRHVVRLSRADEVDVNDAIRVMDSDREPPPRSRLAKASQCRQHREPVRPPRSAATRVALTCEGLGVRKLLLWRKGPS